MSEGKEIAYMGESRAAVVSRGRYCSHMRGYRRGGSHSGLSDSKG